MVRSTNKTLKNSFDKYLSFDYRYESTDNKKPIIIFAHGFKGFKDWGTFNLIANEFAKSNFIFLKLNFSFNGTSPEHPRDFVDLEAFGHNNFSKELDDLTVILDYLESEACEIPEDEIDLNQVYLVGHSKGGATALIKTFEEERIKKTVTWAAVVDVKSRYGERDVEAWRKDGVLYVDNSRTNQRMPLYYQLAEDVLDNEDRFNIPEKLTQTKKPILLIHGVKDTTVDVNLTRSVEFKSKHVKFEYLENADHVFGGKHPWTEQTLPVDTREIIKLSIQFLQIN